MFGEEKGKSCLNDDGVRVTLEINSERAYCDAFIRIDILNIFRKNLKKENQNIKLITHPYAGRYIELTKYYFEYEDGDNYECIPTGISASTERDVEWQISILSSDSGYYKGPHLDSLPIDKNKWTYVTAIDMTYGHHALKYNGLFRCIERALVSSLKTQS